MNDFEADCEGFGRLRFPGGLRNDTSDFRLLANDRGRAHDFLFFFDSRGVGGEFAGSIADRLVRHAEAGARSFLLVCRPLDLTTWATLLNFLAANELAPRRIVTNMGFVDFTPKKQSILDDAVRQVDTLLGPGVASSDFCERTRSSSGEDIPLYSMAYGDAYRERIEALAAQRPLLVVNTPPVGRDIRVPRQRPASFFDAVEQGNAFNRSIRGASIVEPPTFDERHTYDAVHYTQAGNEVIFEKIREQLQS
jgi:hypothetical protein